MEEYKVVKNGVEETMETSKPNEVCDMCPLLNIVHNSGEASQIRYCVMDAALKQAKERYQTCGKDRDLKFGEAPEHAAKTAEELEKDLEDKGVLVDSVLDDLEQQAEEL